MRKILLGLIAILLAGSPLLTEATTAGGQSKSVPAPKNVRKDHKKNHKKHQRKRSGKARAAHAVSTHKAPQVEASAKSLK
jgi:hypothetical protein